MRGSVDPTMRHFKGRSSERSFSLLETIVAVSLVAMLMVEVSGVHGNSIAFSQYGRNVLQASYLAKRVMAQVEYQASIRTPLKDLQTSEKDKPFEDAPDFSYSLTIEPLPHALDLMFKIFSGGMLGGDDDSDTDDKKEQSSDMLGQLKTLIQQSVGDDPIWFAKVEVTWPEGARRGSTELAMVVTDTKKLEESVGKFLDQASAGAGGQTPNSSAPPGPSPTPPAPPPSPPVQ